MNNTDYQNYPVGIIFQPDGTFTLRVTADIFPDPTAVGSIGTVEWHIPLPRQTSQVVIDEGLILIKRVSLDGNAIPTDPLLVNTSMTLKSGLRMVFTFPYPIGMDQARVCFADTGFTLTVDIENGEAEFQVVFGYEMQNVSLHLEVYASGGWTMAG